MEEDQSIITVERINSLVSLPAFYGFFTTESIVMQVICVETFGFTAEWKGWNGFSNSAQENNVFHMTAKAGLENCQ